MVSLSRALRRSGRFNVSHCTWSRTSTSSFESIEILLFDLAEPRSPGAHDGVRRRRHGNRRSRLPREIGELEPGHAARNDCSERFEIDICVQRKAMPADAAAYLDADRRELLVTDPDARMCWANSSIYPDPIIADASRSFVPWPK